MTTDEVIKYLEYADDFMRHNADWHDREAIDMAIKALKNESAIHAHWEHEHETEDYEEAECSHCHRISGTIGKFCPHCGAIMDEKVEDPEPEIDESTTDQDDMDLLLDDLTPEQQLELFNHLNF